jgi:hypothetical protein
MIFRVAMKDTDALYEAIRDAVNEEVAKMGLSKDEAELIAEARMEKVKEGCEKWFEYSEYLTVEIDTEAWTCTVLMAAK